MFFRRLDSSHRFIGPAAFLLAAAVSPWNGTATAATLEVGAGKTYAAPSDAAAAARDGDRVVIAAGTYFDCAIWRASNLTIEGAGPEATVITDKSCEGKGLFITRGNNITIRNLMLTRARVPDFNGAGIRAEGGDLLIDHVQFVNNQNGILAGDRAGTKIIVRNSVFLKNGTCQGGGCAHGLYVGHIALLRVEQSRFAGTKEGHAIKSRAQRTEIVGCDIADGADGTASYAVEAPNGGALVVRDSHIQKGPQSQNHTAAIAIGSEGVTQPTPEIIVAHNSFLVEGDYSSVLVNNVTATDAELTGNVLRGSAKALRGDGSVK
jgi:hypothetical protein